MREEAVRKHLGISKKGFEALRSVITFSCMGCGLCSAVCPNKSLVMNPFTKKPEMIEGEKCIECGFCYMMCPRSFMPLSDINNLWWGVARNEEEERIGRCHEVLATKAEAAKLFTLSSVYSLFTKP